MNGKVTLVHRRLWPALARVAERFPAKSVAAIHEEHTSTGAHRVREQPFPDWVPATCWTQRRISRSTTHPPSFLTAFGAPERRSARRAHGVLATADSRLPAEAGTRDTVASATWRSR